jgi:hypothetical protein
MTVLTGQLVNSTDESKNDVFDGYAVTATFLVAAEDDAGAFVQQSLTVRIIGFNNTFGFDLPPLESISREAELKVRVQDRSGAMVADEVGLAWSALRKLIDSGKPLRIDVRPTEETSTPVTLNGKLVFRDDPDRETGFAGYRVTATYTVRDELVGAFTPGTASVDIVDGNTFRLDLPDREELGTADVRVAAKQPDGQVADTADVPVAELDEAVVLTVDPVRPVVLADGGAPPARRLRGKVVDVAGKVDLRNRQVILWGKRGESELRPIVVETTDAMSNFSTPWPDDVLDSAVATVEGTHHVDPAHGVPIALDLRLDATGEEDGGTLPTFVYVIVTAEPAEGAEDDCACHDQGTPRLPDQEDLVRNPGAYSQDIGLNCVNLTVPNRTLEEFSYTLAVRTSEPDIKGTTLSDLDERRIKIHELVQAVTPSLGQPVVRDVLTAEHAEHAGGTLPADGHPGGEALLGRLAAGRSVRSLLEAEVAVDTELLVNDLVLPGVKTVAGRGALTVANSVDWDSSATFYQATTIAHGHILTFKQVWKADGYSLGDLLYSLPLAPGQKKQVVIFDWDRTQYGTREESGHEDEALNAYLSHDRDINDITSGSFSESLRGGSKATTWGAATGGGAALSGTVGAFFLGATGGHSLGIGQSSSSAWQDASRKVSAQGLNQLRDQVQQGASAVRNQRSTVVQVQRETERFKVQTEVVANHNHCHALTVEYFEVLRHYAIEQQLAQVTECLFIPLLMGAFDDHKVLRWMDILRASLVDPNPPRLRRLPSGGISLQHRPLADGFDAIERKSVNWVGTDFPDTTYANEEVVDLSGDLTMTFVLNRPKDKDDDVNNIDDLAWAVFGKFMPWTPKTLFNRFFAGRSQQDRDAAFERDIAPKIVEGMVDQLHVYAVTPGGQAIPLAVDTTLVSTYRREVPLQVSVRPTAAAFGLRRSDIAKLVLTTDFDLSGTDFNKIIVRSANLRYRTRHFEGSLYANASVNNDMRSLTVPGAGTSATDGVALPTPLSTEETRNLRNEDRELATRLVKHLNANLERYHRALWLTMDPDRRYMLLDGFLAPNAGGKSVASVVENRVIGIAGNSLIMPVAPGHKLDPSYEVRPLLDDHGEPRLDDDGNVVYEQVDLLDHYRPLIPPPPYRVSVPTRGVFAEAVMGACNSCEKKDETRFWRWEESPNPDEPTPINPITTGTPQWNEQTGLTPTPFPTPMVNIQNAPAAPEPGATLGSVFDLLGKTGVFKDVTGLDQNQKNALQALTTNVEAAKHYADKATELAKLAANQRGGDSTIESIKKAEQDGTISKETASQLTEDALRAKISGKTSSDKDQTAEKSKLGEAAAKAVEAGREVNATQSHPDGTETTVEQKKAGEAVSIDLSKNTAQARAFNPPTGEAIGMLDPVIIGTRPTGSTLKWEGDLEFLPGLGDGVRLVPHSGGVKTVRCSLVDPAGNVLTSASTSLSVPVLVAWVSSLLDHFLQNALDEIKLGDRRPEVTTRIQAVVSELLPGMNLRLFAEDTPELVADMYRVNVSLVDETADHPRSLVTERYRNIEGTLGGAVSIGLSSFPDLPYAGAAYKALTDALKAAASPSASLRSFTEEFLARIVGRITAYGVLKVLEPSAEATGVPSFEALTGYSLPAGVTASNKPSDYTDLGVTAMKLPDDWVNDVRKRLPIPPDFA